jgi:hypothetical protein
MIISLREIGDGCFGLQVPIINAEAEPGIPEPRWAVGFEKKGNPRMVARNLSAA